MTKVEFPHNNPLGTEERTIALAHTEHPQAWKWSDYFTFNIDHKVIGIQYLVTAFVFYIIGGLMAVVMRVELATPESDLISPDLYNAFMTNHGTLMILDWTYGCHGRQTTLY